MTLFAYPLSLPATVPVGGAAVLLVDGRPADEPVRAAGALAPVAGRSTAALLFPKTRLRLTLEVTDLRSAEGARLDLSLHLDLRIADPLRCFQDLVGEAREMTCDEVGALLAKLLQTALRPVAHGLRLADFDADRNLRAWLQQAVRSGLDDVDLAGRSGLVVETLDAYDLRCQALAEGPGARQDAAAYYLRATLADQDAAGKRVLDEALIAALQAAAPTSLTPSELRPAQAAPGTPTGRMAARSLPSVLRGAPSALRPELWRHGLQAARADGAGVKVESAPLVAAGRVWVATQAGNLLAFDAATGAPAPELSVDLGTAPGDALAWAAGLVWVPGHSGMLLGIAPTTGQIVRRVAIGGKLSSAPLVEGDRLYVAVNIDKQRWQDAATGSVAVVDARGGRLIETWPVDAAGLRSQPARLGQWLAVADGRGRLHLVGPRGAVALPLLRGGRVGGGVCVDATANRLMVGDSYGLLRSLDADGKLLRETRLEAGIVGRPLLHEGRLWVGCADGKLFCLDPATFRPLYPPFVTHGPIVTSPVGRKGLVFVGSHDGHLYALHSDTGARYWSYRSGYPLLTPPAVDERGRLYLVDEAGHLSALHWCLTHYADAARAAEEAGDREEAVELWLKAGLHDAALDAAKQARRLDWVARICHEVQLYDQAAQAHEQLARASKTPARQAAHWRAAAEAWMLAQDGARAGACDLARADALELPLLALERANDPALTVGRVAELQVVVRNLTARMARRVTLAYRGQLQSSGELELHSLGPKEERTVTIPVAPTASGSARLWLALRYCDAQEQSQPPVEQEALLAVAQAPVVQNFYQGPVIGGDGTIILRGWTPPAPQFGPETLPPGSSSTVYGGPVIHGDGVILQRMGTSYGPEAGGPVAGGQVAGGPPPDAPDARTYADLPTVTCPMCGEAVPATRYCCACNATLI